MDILYLKSIAPIFLTITIIYIYIKYLYTYWQRQGIPYINPVFIFGNLKPLLLKQKSYGETIADLHVRAKQMNLEYAGIYALTYPNLLVIDPNLIKDIFIKSFSSFNERGFYYNEETDPLSAHLIALRNPKWQQLRQKFTPTFTVSKLKMVFPIIRDRAKELGNVVGKFADNNLPVDARDIFTSYTIDVIVRTSLGIESNTLNDPQSEFKRIGNEFFAPTLKNSLILSLSFIAPEIMNFFNISITTKSAQEFFMNAIKKTVEYRESNNIEEKDFMSLLIKLKNNKNIDENNIEDESDVGITFNQLAAQAFLFFIAGFETSASAMTFMMYELAQNDEIQDKLRREINDEIEKNGEELTYDVLMGMKYLDCCINETLRKYPSVTTINRECVKDYEIPGTDRVVRKGTKVLISSLALHRDPEFYPDPEKFDPDRFSDERKAEINPNTYCPMGLGPRNCIGYRFGLMSIKISMATFFKDYKVSFHPEKKIPRRLSSKHFLLNLEGPLWLKVEKVV